MGTLSASCLDLLLYIQNVVTTEYMNLKLIETAMQDELEDGDVTQINIRFIYRELNSSILLDIKIHNTICVIGVWEMKTADISIFSAKTGDSFYEYHAAFEDEHEIAKYIKEAFAVIAEKM